MIAILRHQLARYRGQILGWGIAMFLLGAMMISFYGTIKEQSAQLEQLIQSYPPEMMAFFGGDFEGFTTPSGYLSAELFALLPVILGVFAVLIGSGLLVSDEENGTLDLIAAHPISRTTLFAGRVLAFITATAAILIIAWLGLVLTGTATNFEATWLELARPFLSLLGILLVFGTLALLLSMLLPSRRMAAMAAGVLLIASYFITSLARINEELEPIARLSPLTYYQSGDAMLGLKLDWLAGLLIVAALFTLLAWRLFDR
ncbi:MAG: ABC transporter permease subunit, partial [Ardenticatenaceae bacterium]